MRTEVPAAATIRSLQGCLLGTAVGDSVGLPFENLSRKAVGTLVRLPLEQSLFAGKGMVSDDTEHTVMVALSLLESGRDVGVFRRRLAARLRWWLLAGPPGVGSATARSILKLWLGWPPASSGVFSAGNGPAMRSALLGVAFGHEPALLAQFVQASTRITHTDPKACEAALAVAVAAGCAARAGPLAPREAWQAFSGAFMQAGAGEAALGGALAHLRTAVEEGVDVAQLAERLGCGKGVTGYALHTVPAALYAWMRHAGDLREAVTTIVRCGGDTDSTATVVGAIVGAGVGPQGVPQSWLAELREWPRGKAWMERLAPQVAVALQRGSPAPLGMVAKLREVAWSPWMLVRNLTMFAIVIYVLFRRWTLLALRLGRREVRREGTGTGSSR